MPHCRRLRDGRGNAPSTAARTLLGAVTDVSDISALMSAIGSVQEGDTIRLTQNISDISQIITLSTSENYTIDLNGHTLTLGYGLVHYGTGTLTIMGGTITSSNSTTVVKNNPGTIDLLNTNIEAYLGSISALWVSFQYFRQHD